MIKVSRDVCVVSSASSTLPDIQQALSKYLLNGYYNQQVVDCELLDSRVFIVGMKLGLIKIQHIKHRQQILGLETDTLGFESHMA